MFTGIIKGRGNVKTVSGETHLKTVTIEAPSTWRFKKGESVNVSGICSTVVKSVKNSFDVEYMKETLDVTTAKFFTKNLAVNLEKSLKVGDPIDGHFVYGHIDTMGKITQFLKFKDQAKMQIKIPIKYLKYIVYKGSVAVDGVSLTVSKKETTYFEVSLIPYTISHTTLEKLKVGDNVNIETDVIAKFAIK